jgi:glycosyltransferase involved in cell wall biosynthesis
MTPSRLAILQVGTYDSWGGAEMVAQNLVGAYRRRGHEAHLAVGRRLSDASDALTIAGRRSQRTRTEQLAHPGRIVDLLRGLETFRFPETYGLLGLPPRPPDVLHAHNLHGGYFDLRALPWLSEQVPLVLTLHDAWLLTGHCAHFFGCSRWQTGCGECPDLTIYPPVRRDATAANWRRKRDVFRRSTLHVATPSRWLLEHVERSMLMEAVAETRVIPNGVDRSVFRPADRASVRRELGIPGDASVLLFVGSGLSRNEFKDYETLRAAVALVAAELSDRQLLLIGVGDDQEPERLPRGAVRFVPVERARGDGGVLPGGGPLRARGARGDVPVDDPRGVGVRDARRRHRRRRR